jgi:hypothetical protein
MKPNSKNALDAIVFLLMLLFIYAATIKLIGYTAFRSLLSQSVLFKQIPDLIALGVPLLELGIAALLFNPRSRLIGLYASFALMLAFTIYITYMLIFIEKNIRPCGCGGVLNNLGWEEHLIFNIGFTLLSALGIFMQLRHKNHNEPLPGY